MDIPICVDFETLPILNGTGRKPKPVGVSILVPGQPNVYYGWGHPGANPHTFACGKRALSKVWEHPLVFHNCKFDIGVAIEHMGFDWPERYDDTMFQAYLVSPLERSLGLKTLAERLLGEPPDEQQAVYRWLRANFKGPFLPEHKIITENNFGAYIGYAPYDVVAPYAMGDTTRTRGLHAFLMPKVEKAGMRAAYERELAIAQVGYHMEYRGVRVDRPRLMADYEKYERIKAEQGDTIHSYLGDIDIDKPTQVARALLEHGYADSLPLTPTKRMSTSKASIESSVTEPKLLKALRYRATLKTLTGTFFKGWVEYSALDGHVHPSWNQTLNADGFGARTGRFSCIAEGEMVRTSNGLCRIEDVQVGDEVLTHKNRFREVVRSMFMGWKKTYKISLEGGASVVCTSDHRILTNNGWLSLEDMDGCEKDQRPVLDRRGNGTGNTGGLHLGGIRSDGARYWTKHRAEDFEGTNVYRGTEGSASDVLLPQQKRREQPHEGEARHPAPQLQGGHSRQGRLCDSSAPSVVHGQAESEACRGTPDRNVRGAGADRDSEGLGNSSHRRGQDPQHFGQFGAAHQFGAFSSTRGFRRICQVDYVGIQRVYDLEVEEDHSFVAGDVFVHNCSAPNLTNVPTEFGEGENDVLHDADLPFMRQYLLPDEGQIIVPADFNGQEMRIMAHYAEGRAQQVYTNDPHADFHAVASTLIKQYVGLTVPRKMCKIVGFSLIYGSGVATLARQLCAAGFPTSEDTARRIKNAYFKAIPGLAEFVALFRNRKQVKTWGGRILPAEEPRMVDGEWREFYYKLCNYLIQGSAADQSKEAMLRYNAQREHGRLLMMVHDELVISVPQDYASTEVPILRDSMESMPGWDCPFRVEVEYGHNWHELFPFNL